MHTTGAMSMFAMRTVSSYMVPCRSVQPRNVFASCTELALFATPKARHSLQVLADRSAIDNLCTVI